jgi:hypothetical protein
MDATQTTLVYQVNKNQTLPDNARLCQRCPVIGVLYAFVINACERR